jgi:hypothetical protein
VNGLPVCLMLCCNRGKSVCIIWTFGICLWGGCFCVGVYLWFCGWNSLILFDLYNTSAVPRPEDDPVRVETCCLKIYMLIQKVIYKFLFLFCCV